MTQASLLSSASSGSRAARRRTGTWLVTFTDLTALMLAFFVMLFSMSSADEAKWRALMGVSLSSDEVEADAGPGAERDTRNIAAVDAEPGRDLDYLSALLSRQLADEPRLGGAILQRQPDRVVISFPDELLFEPNSATLRTGADAALFALGGILRNLPNRVELEGHTDPNPPDPGRFTSNWDLSLRRALAVSVALQRAGYTRTAIVRGYGASRAAMLSPRLDQPLRHALARRVDVVVHQAAESKR